MTPAPLSGVIMRLRELLADEDGVTAIEYSLIAALIAVTIIGAVQLVGTNVNNVFNTIANKLAGVH